MYPSSQGGRVAVDERREREAKKIARDITAELVRMGQGRPPAPGGEWSHYALALLEPARIAVRTVNGGSQYGVFDPEANEVLAWSVEKDPQLVVNTALTLIRTRRGNYDNAMIERLAVMPDAEFNGHHLNRFSPNPAREVAEVLEDWGALIANKREAYKKAWRLEDLIRWHGPAAYADAVTPDDLCLAERERRVLTAVRPNGSAVTLVFSRQLPEHAKMVRPDGVDAALADVVRSAGTHSAASEFHAQLAEFGIRQMEYLNPDLARQRPMHAEVYAAFGAESFMLGTLVKTGSGRRLPFDTIGMIGRRAQRPLVPPGELRPEDLAKLTASLAESGIKTFILPDHLDVQLAALDTEIEFNRFLTEYSNLGGDYEDIRHPSINWHAAKGYILKPCVDCAATGSWEYRKRLTPEQIDRLDALNRGQRQQYENGDTVLYQMGWVTSAGPENVRMAVPLSALRYNDGQLRPEVTALRSEYAYPVMACAALQRDLTPYEYETVAKLALSEGAEFGPVPDEEHENPHDEKNDPIRHRIWEEYFRAGWEKAPRRTQARNETVPAGLSTSP